MGRSFYTDEETAYSVPGLPTVAQTTDALPSASSAPSASASASNSSNTINKFGNYITTSSGLENFVSKIRKTTQEYYEIADEKFQYITGTGQAHFIMTIDRIYNFKGEDEQLLPNGCSVLTATLLGSIVSRNHSFPIRFFTPIIFGGIALNFALPQTYKNVSDGFKNIGIKLENKYFPEFTKTRQDTCASISEISKSVENLQKESFDNLVNAVSYARKTVCDTFGKKD
ncbi:hypothetical protein C6P40_001408 [Pichia californica]|uniref:MICOS complex subunit n=1 Tax=Pichia californica TaxID=460514 RepID=A0A9P7BFY0_9ASCO|nr:hypothetical protein C6P40_001408 [[Candida] californica]